MKMLHHTALKDQSPVLVVSSGTDLAEINLILCFYSSLEWTNEILAPDGAFAFFMSYAATVDSPTILEQEIKG